MRANVFKVPVIGSFAALDLRGGNTLTSVRVCAGPSEFSKAALSQFQEVKRSKTSMPLGDNGGPAREGELPTCIPHQQDGSPAAYLLCARRATRSHGRVADRCKECDAGVNAAHRQPR